MKVVVTAIRCVPSIPDLKGEYDVRICLQHFGSTAHLQHGSSDVNISHTNIKTQVNCRCSDDDGAMPGFGHTLVCAAQQAQSSTMLPQDCASGARQATRFVQQCFSKCNMRRTVHTSLSLGSTPVAV